MSPENLVFLKKLKRAGNKNFRISETSITGFLKEARPEYDVILALAVLHHLVQSEEKIQELKMVLSTLRAREMFFLPHDQSDKWMRNAHWNPGETEFVDFITRHSHFKTAVRIGSAGHGRSLYRLT